MKFLHSKTGKVATAAVVLLALFLIRPGANQLRNRVVNSLSLALGRPVEIAKVSVRLLPWPGFDLQGFVVHEDPAFGAEPTLRADDVTAKLRLTSLLRGRLEISSLVLSEPSLNLVQDASGHWNLENLLERANRTPIAPTTKGKMESRPGFPYIEADDGRVNFKVGQEKKPYALTNADFSVWQGSENTWGMRLRADPVRTDFNLSDTGTVRVNGSWHRASSLRETPVRFELEWERGQLGQVTKLAYGTDLGWRGGIDVSATVTGTPGDLSIVGQASVNDFRRFDLPEGDALRLALGCNARYSSADRSLPEVSCQSPVGEGLLRLNGAIGGEPGSRAYNLELIAKGIPMQAIVELAKHAKGDIPDDLVATGKLDAAFKFLHKNGVGQQLTSWTGGGQTENFAIGSAEAKIELPLGKVPFSVSSGAGLKASAQPALRLARFAGVAHLEVGPFNLAMGRPAPTVVRAWLSRTDYGLQIAGDTQIRHLLQLARALGMPALQPPADGIAKVDLQIAGRWSAFTAAKALGTAQLRAVRAEVRGMNEPLEIASANVALQPDGVEVSNISASVAGGTWHGSLQLPRGCAGGGACPVQFDLHADSLATTALNKLFDPHPRSRPWYRFLAPAPAARNPYLLTLRASGRLSANRVTIYKLVASKVSANVDLENGVAHLSGVRADLLGGKHVGDWKADFTGKAPEYSGSGSLQHVVLGQLAQAMHDSWITGTGNATYQATASGLTATELLDSAKATLDVQAFGGTLPHIVLQGNATPLHVRSLTGRLVLHDRQFEVQDGKLEIPDGAYDVSGTATLTRTLDLTLARTGFRGFSITGPLIGPRVAETSTPQTRASLKP